MILTLQTGQIIFTAEELFDLGQDFAFEPRAVPDLIERRAVNFQSLGAFASSLLNIARPDSPNDLLVLVLCASDQFFGQRGGFLIQPFRDLQLDDVFVKLFIVRMVVQQFLPCRQGFAGLAVADVELALQFGDGRGKFVVGLGFTGRVQIGDGRFKVQRSRFDHGFVIPGLSVLGIVGQRDVELLQSLDIVALLGVKKRQQESVRRGAVLFDSIVEELCQFLDRSRVQPGVVEAVEQVSRIGPFQQNRVIAEGFAIVRLSDGGGRNGKHEDE